MNTHISKIDRGIIRSVLLVLILLQCSVQGFAQSDDKTSFWGVSSFNQYKDNKIEYILLGRANDLYSNTQNIYPTILQKWRDNKEKYFPLMYEAWNYCMQKCPDDKNLYLDGEILFRKMIENSDDKAKKQEYFDSLMAVYDKRIANIDAINAHVHKATAKSSENTVRLGKVNDWALYSPNRPINDSLLLEEKLYEGYLNVFNSIIEDINEGKDAGGDLRVEDIGKFFNYSVRHYVNTYNSIEEPSIIAKKRDEMHAYRDSLRALRDVAQNSDEKNRLITLINDSIDGFNTVNDSLTALWNIKKGKIKSVTLGHFHFVKYIAEKQKESLASDSINTVYTNLVYSCERYMDNTPLMNGESMADIEEQFKNQLEDNSDNKDFLTTLLSRCRCSDDFRPSHPFFHTVDSMLKNMPPDHIPSDITEEQLNRFKAYLTEARKFYNYCVDTRNEAYGVIAASKYDMCVSVIPYNKLKSSMAAKIRRERENLNWYIKEYTAWNSGTRPGMNHVVKTPKGTFSITFPNYHR